MGIENCSKQMLQNIHKHPYAVVFKQYSSQLPVLLQCCFIVDFLIKPELNAEKIKRKPVL